MHYEKNIWAETWVVFKENIKVVLTFVALTLVVELLDFLWPAKHGSYTYAATVFIGVMLAIPAHATVLSNHEKFGFSGSADSKEYQMSFFLRVVGLGLLSAILPLVALILYMFLLPIMHPSVMAFLIMVIWLVSAAFVFARWGTVLPAIVNRGDKRFAAAAMRSKVVFWYAFPRLLISFGAVFAIFGVILIGASILLGLLTNFDPSADRFDFWMVLLSVVSALVGAYQVIMTAVVLSRSYLQAESHNSDMN